MTVTNDPRSVASDLPEVVLPARLMSENEFEIWVFEQEEGRYEWVDGTVTMMSPASYAHDDLDIWLSMLIRPLLREMGLTL